MSKTQTVFQLASVNHGYGFQSWLARELTKLGYPVSTQAVQKWCAAGVVPPRRILAVEHITGIPRHLLCPELYPSPGEEKAGRFKKRAP